MKPSLDLNENNLNVINDLLEMMNEMYIDCGEETHDHISFEDLEDTMCKIKSYMEEMRKYGQENT